MIAPSHSWLSINRQCSLLGLPRSSYYHTSRGESEENLLLMRLLDAQYTKTPFYGVPRMTEHLNRLGFIVNRKRVARLMGVMGLQAIYPKKRLSFPGDNQRIYPYLLGGMVIDHPDQVWCTDITYIRMQRSFLYLAAVMDWFSRYVLSWGLSVSLESDFCQSALEQALCRHAVPKIFNSDQGKQFTCDGFTKLLHKRGILVSMDGRGRVYDNIFIERLWRSVKYEEVYLRDYRDRAEAEDRLGRYFRFYNQERFHQGLDYATPAEVYDGKRVAC
jgi:putative transposase